MKVAFIGTGVLGAPMAARLASQGVDVVAWNRTESKASRLRKHGVQVVATVGEALASAEVAIVMLADAAAIRDVLFPAGATEQLAGRTLVQMGTIGPDESRAFAVMAERAGARWVEAPVLGSVPQADNGELLILFGGTSAGHDGTAAVLRHLGHVMRIGDVGDAALLKLALNQIIGAQVTGFSASLALVRRAGLDPELLMGALRRSSFHAPTFDAKLPRMLARDFDKPNFPAIHLLKDLDLFLAEAEEKGLGTDGVAGVRQVVAAAVGMGHAESDYSAVYEAVDPPDAE